jgi:hypothetical protein
MGMLTATNFDPCFLNRRFQKQTPRAKVQSLALMLHMQKVPFQVEKAAILQSYFVGFPQTSQASARIAPPNYARKVFFHVVPVDA